MLSLLFGGVAVAVALVLRLSIVGGGFVVAASVAAVVAATFVVAVAAVVVVVVYIHPLLVYPVTPMNERND